jgi:hypothetical protein
MDRMKRAAALVLAALLASCRGGTREEAEQAVRTYLTRLVDAYRTSDASLVDPLVNDQQGLKLVGLIGVKRDAGVVLDAKLLEIQFDRAAREGDQWVVETRERWYYRDRKIGTGEQMGEDSTDSYAMRYRFGRKGDRLILEDLEFIGEPRVGRKEAPMPVDPKILHGLAGGDPGSRPGGQAPGARAVPPGQPPAGPVVPAPERRP